MRFPRMWLAGVAVALTSLFAGGAAHAGLITGSQGVASLGALADSPSLASATVFTLEMNSTTLSATGNYAGYGVASLDNTLLNTASLSTFAFGSTDFGSFSASTGVELASPSDTRTFYFTGNFLPGSNLLFDGLSNNTASVLMNVNQSGGTGGAISLSWSLNTPIAAPPVDPVTPASVPEPSTAALAGLGVAAALLWRRMRRREIPRGH